MAEEKKSGLWLPVLIAVIPITVGVIQYNSTRQSEFRKKFWEEQLVLYKDASEAASEIAMSASLQAAAPARAKFWKLYWGKLSMIEHKEVEQAMKSFGDRLGQCETGQGAPCFAAAAGSVSTDLRVRSYHLAHCMRFSLSETWNPAQIENSRDICPHTKPK